MAKLLLMWFILAFGAVAYADLQSELALALHNEYLEFHSKPRPTDRLGNPDQRARRISQSYMDLIQDVKRGKISGDEAVERYRRLANLRSDYEKSPGRGNAALDEKLARTKEAMDRWASESRTFAKASNPPASGAIHTAAVRPNGGTEPQVAAAGDKVGDPPLDDSEMAGVILASDSKSNNSNGPKQDSIKATSTTASVPPVGVDDCTYAGFTVNVSDRTRRCARITDLREARDKAGLALKIDTPPEKQKCAKGLMMCNPLIAGLTDDQRVICIRPSKSALEKCKSVRAPEARIQSLGKLLKIPENEKAFELQVKKANATCGAKSVALKNKADFAETCRNLLSELKEIDQKLLNGKNFPATPAPAANSISAEAQADR